jgi:integrase/recombinase XerD
MSRRLLSHEIHVHAWLGASELSAHWAGYVRDLLDQGYRKSTVLPYRAAVAHFGHWMTVHSVRLRDLNEAQVERFLQRHLPVCRCGALRQRWPHTVRAALRALLRYLRIRDVIEPARPTDPPAVTRELQAFAHFQEHVCGLTQATRDVSRLRVRGSAFVLWQMRYSDGGN